MNRTIVVAFLVVLFAAWVGLTIYIGPDASIPEVKTRQAVPGN